MKPKDMPINSVAQSEQEVVLIRRAKDYVIVYSDGDLVITSQIAGIREWTPLVPQDANHPTLRKLGEGEAVVAGQRYVFRNLTDGFIGMFRASDQSEHAPNYDYYEVVLPPLTPAGEAEPEPQIVSHEDGESLAGEVTLESLERKFGIQSDDPDAPGYFPPVLVRNEPAPAPSTVGEQLTEPPEVGTPVIKFFPKEPDHFVVWRWGRGDYLSAQSYRYYRWHGPIPTEPPEPEREEGCAFCHEPPTQTIGKQVTNPEHGKWYWKFRHGKFVEVMQWSKAFAPLPDTGYYELIIPPDPSENK